MSKPTNFFVYAARALCTAAIVFGGFSITHGVKAKRSHDELARLHNSFEKDTAAYSAVIHKCIVGAEDKNQEVCSTYDFVENAINHTAKTGSNHIGWSAISAKGYKGLPGPNFTSIDCAGEPMEFKEVAVCRGEHCTSFSGAWNNALEYNNDLFVKCGERIKKTYMPSVKGIIRGTEQKLGMN